MLLASSPFLYAGLGFCLVFLYREGGPPENPVRVPFFLGLGVIYAAGLSLAYLVTLLAPSLGTALFVCALLALAGWAYFFLRIFPRLPAPPAGKSAFFLAVLLVYGIKMLAEPIRDWDARSIWFFQAKILYYGNGFSLDWANPHYRFANLDYPKLLPVLAAQGSHLLGYWNEYLPKIGLWHLLVPLAAGLAYLASWSWPFVIYFLLALLAPGSWMWNGYMDGYVALYAGLATVLWWRGEGKGRPGHAGALVFLLIASQLKKEGILVCAAWLLASWMLFFSCWKSFLARHRLLAFVPFLVLALPVFVWERRVRSLGLTNQLFGGGSGLADAWRKIAQESALQNITRSILFDGHVASLLVLLAVCGALGRWAGIRMGRVAAFAPLFAVLFFPAIYAILIVSPMNQHLPGNLSVNMNRVPLSVLQVGFAFVYIFMRKFLREEDSYG